MAIVKLFAGLRKIAGTRELVIPGTSIAEVLAGLAARDPALIGQLYEDGQIRQHIITTLNGHPTTDYDAPVTEHDQIAIFPPIAGG